MTRVLWKIAVFVTVVLWPAALFGQGRAVNANDSDVRITPIVGAYFVNVDTRDLGGGGILAGVRFGLPFGEDLRLVAEIARTEANDVGRVGFTQNYVVFGEDHWLTSAGLAFDVLDGRTSAVLGFQAGAVFRKTEAEEIVGPEGRNYLPSEEYTPSILVAPVAAVEYSLSSAVSLRLAFKDYLLSPFQSARHQLALTAGVSIGL